MDNLTRLLVALVLAGVAITLLAGAVRWYMDEGRQVRRGLKAVLKGEAHGFLVARGRGRGVGFDFSANSVAVVWDKGAWGYLYTLDELMGAEAIVDRQVVGRVHRGEARMAVDAFDAEERVALRLVFDDLSQPDFVLDLWLPEDEGRRDELPPGEAIAEANRWLARIESLLRRPTKAGGRPAAAPAPTAPSPLDEPPPPPGPPPPIFNRQDVEDDDEEPLV